MTMDDVWQRVLRLTNSVFEVTSGLQLPRDNPWSTTVILFLAQSNEQLDSIKILLDKNHYYSAVILTRSLFEGAVNLAYIGKDVQQRLDKYLGHGGIPLTQEDARQMQQNLENDTVNDVWTVVPKGSWKTLKDMCCELGLQWLREYETFYRYASIPTHAGSFTLGNNLMQLLEQQPPSESQKAGVLITALEFHLRIAQVAGNVFPEQINLEKVKTMSAECDKLGQFLTKMQA